MLRLDRAGAQLNATFAALADPTRRAILTRLAAGEASLGTLAKPFAMSPPAITKHLKVLENAGLIVRRRQAQSLICRLDAAPLEAAVTWLEFYRRFWDESFDRLDDYLAEMKSSASRRPNRPNKKRKAPN
jgi:DNA-binding transcriptional ArsR family regulator